MTTDDYCQRALNKIKPWLDLPPAILLPFLSAYAKAQRSAPIVTPATAQLIADCFDRRKAVVAFVSSGSLRAQNQLALAMASLILAGQTGPQHQLEALQRAVAWTVNLTDSEFSALAAQALSYQIASDFKDGFAPGQQADVQDYFLTIREPQDPGMN